MEKGLGTAVTGGLGVGVALLAECVFGFVKLKLPAMQKARFGSIEVYQVYYWVIGLFNS